MRDFQNVSSGSGEEKPPRLRKRLRAYRARRRRERRPRQPIRQAAVPSFFTLMNLMSGFLAITQAFQGEVIHACWFIILAGFFDAMDGMMARLTDSVSSFGVELDSLCDIVSFGVAPAFLLYAFGLQEFGVLGSFVAALPALCGAVRLARFNINFDGGKGDYFNGMPIPVQAIFIVALILNFEEASWFSRFSTSNLSTLIPLVIVLAGLMVSSVPFDAMIKPKPEYVRSHPRKVMAFGVALLLLVFLQQLGLLIVLTSYTLVGIGRAIYKVIHEVMNVPVEDSSFDESTS